MGFTEILTIIFVVLKLLSIIDWSWWLVLSPEIIGVSLYIVFAVIPVVFMNRTTKKIVKLNKSLRDKFDK